MSIFNLPWRSRARRARELDAEIAAHLAMDAQARVARGESLDEARHNAALDFGNTLTVREVTSDMWSGEALSRTIRDVRQAARGLARAPGFSLVAIATLALGIGANTAIFSVMNGVLLRPLPYPAAHELVFVTSQFAAQGRDRFWLDPAEWIELRERAHAFQEVAGYRVQGVNVGADASPRRVQAAFVTSGFFQTLGVQPMQGRPFSEAETFPGSAPVAILSRELWQSAFGGRPLLGQRIQVNGVATVVVGIMPAGFDVHDEGARLWLPLRLDPAQRNTYRAQHYLDVVARLRPGMTLSGARTELETLLARWNVADGGSPGAKCCGKGFVHTPDPTLHRLVYANLQADMVGGIGRSLWVLQASVLVVLLIACANLANLLLMRAESRHKELALRAALGAGRGRLMVHFMSESLALSGAGAVAGTLLAYGAVRALVAFGAATIPRVQDISIDGRVLLFTIGLALACGVFFGLAPMLHASSARLGLALREAGSRTVAAAARNRVRRVLVITEVALAVMLVIGAGLLLRSFWNLMRVDAGFDRRQLTTFAIALPPRVYTDSSRRVAFFDDLTRKLSAVPGIQSAAAMTGLPPRRELNANDAQFEGFTPQANRGPQANVDYDQYVTPGYFATMRIPIVAGRAFGASDGPQSPPVLLINETTARIYYPDQSPIGRRIKPNGDSVWFTVIGVAKDVKQGGVDSQTGTEVYLDVQQTPHAEGYGPPTMNVVVRSRFGAATLAPIVRRIVGSLDPSLPVIQLRSMDDVFAEAVARPHFLAALLGVFAVVALLLAAIGTYGVLAYSVVERRREIGIRMALGATTRGVLGMVLRQGLTLALVGLGLGLAGAAALTRLGSTLLFGVAPTDPATFAAVSAFMLIVAIAASMIPAQRATRVDPIVALSAD